MTETDKTEEATAPSPNELPSALSERLVAGHNIDGSVQFSSLVGGAAQPTLLVFLRHYG